MVFDRDYADPDGAEACERCGAEDGRYVPRLDACLCRECFETVQRRR